MDGDKRPRCKKNRRLSVSALAHRDQHCKRIAQTTRPSCSHEVYSIFCTSPGQAKLKSYVPSKRHCPLCRSRHDERRLVPPRRDSLGDLKQQSI
jgi:hypothetical protein